MKEVSFIHSHTRTPSHTSTPSYTQSHLEVHREVPTRHHEEVALGHATLLILCHRVGEGHRLPSVHLDIGRRAYSTQQQRGPSSHGTCTMMGRSTPATGGRGQGGGGGCVPSAFRLCRHVTGNSQGNTTHIPAHTHTPHPTPFASPRM